MQKKNLVRLLIAKMSLVTVLGACYLTYRNHQHIRRASDYVTGKYSGLKDGYFKDPSGLDVIAADSSDGKKDLYLMHSPSYAKVRIMEDQYPDTRSMLEKLVERSKTDVLDTKEARSYLKMMNQIERNIQERY